MKNVKPGTESGVNEESGQAYGSGANSTGTSTVGMSGSEMAAQAAANHLSANMGSNLKTANDPQVVGGGSAASALSPATSMKKRKGGGLSSQLGINV